MTTLNDRMVPAERVYDLVVANLDEFQGFDGLEYFYLRKDLMPPLVANIVTYLVILMQFRLS